MYIILVFFLCISTTIETHNVNYFNVFMNQRCVLPRGKMIWNMEGENEIDSCSIKDWTSWCEKNLTSSITKERKEEMME